MPDVSMTYINAMQAQAFYPAALRSYQFISATSATVTYKGTFLDRYGKALSAFDITIAASGGTVHSFRSLGDEPPEAAVGAVGVLSGTIYVNTGRDPDDDTVDVAISTATGAYWIEYANPRLMLGLVA